MNAKYLLVRQLFKNMVQKKIFEPIAEENGFYDIDEDGFKHYYYPKLSFERLSIIDNDQNFDKLFNLYQKGSLPVGYIYEILNIDQEQATQKLKQDMFTVKDPTFNEMIRETYTRVGDDFQQKTNLGKLLAKSLYVNGTQIVYKDQDTQDSQNSDNPFDTQNQNNESESQNQNKEQNLDKQEKQLQKHSIQISDDDFRKFMQTQQLAVTDQDIKQFLKQQNIAVVKNKDLKQFMKQYFLKPSNVDVDQFMDVIDEKLHPNNKMFENFLDQLHITKVTNKDVEQFLKLFFLKPTNNQIQEFLKRYNLLQVTDDNIAQFLNENKNENKEKIELNDSEIQDFINSQNSLIVNNQDINNFELMNKNKFEI